MRHWILPIAALTAFALGCNKGTEGGTQGTHATVTVVLPGPASQDVKQGDTRTLDGSLDRGSDFKKDVTLKVEAPPKVVVKLGKESVKASEGDTKFTISITPDKDAPLGEHVIKVTATPAGGGTAAENKFKVNVTSH